MRTGAAFLATIVALGGFPAAADDYHDRAPVSLPDPDAVLAGGFPGPVVAEPWWSTLGDPTLEALIDEGLGGNGDVQAAWDRTIQAEARAAQALAPALPSASFNTGANIAPYDSLGFSFGGFPEVEWPEFPDIPGIEWPDLAEDETEDPAVYWIGQLTLDVRVPLDLWGSAIPTHRAGRYDRLASEGDAEAQAHGLATRIARVYYDVIAARQQIAIVEEQLETQRALLEITELRFEQSDATALDVLQQRQQVAAGEARIPQARQLARTGEAQLATLIGRPSGSDLGLEQALLPDLGGLPSTGRSLDLVDNRPDLRAAAARLDAAHQRVAAAGRAFLPSLALTGQVGLQWNHFTELESQDTWGAGVSLSLPVFEGTRRWQVVRETRAGEHAMTRQFEQLVLQAVQEVEVALLTEEEQRAQLAALRDQDAAASMAFEESRARYAAGLTSYLNVLVAATTQQQAELGVLQAERALIDTRIGLHESLGGQWTGSLSRDRGERP